MSNLNSFKKELGVRWIQADSGNTYLCPVGAIDGLENASEDELRARCVDESTNPQNS